MRSPLERITTFRIPHRVIAETVKVLAEAGNEGHEAFVLWGAVIEPSGESLTFRRAVAPRQTGHKTPDGLLVTVEGDALFQVNREFYQRGELLAGQVHSHPTAAYHSSTDDHFPLVTLVGALSVVVPDFAARAPGDIKDWAWYRLVGPALWDELTRHDRIELFED